MNKKNEVKKLPLKIDEKTAEGIYSNISNIMSSEAEFILDFGRIMPAKANVTVLARIIASPQHAKSFMLALSKNIETYENKHGEINIGSQAKHHLGFQGNQNETSD